MTDSNTTMNSTIQPLALQIILAVGAQAQTIQHPVASVEEAKRIMREIRKTPGFYALSEDSDGPVMFHVRHVVAVQIVLLPPKVAPPQIARVN